MDINKAKKLSKLVAEHNRYESILKAMESGYSDEWEFRNNYTGTVVEFSHDDWTEIKTMMQRKLKEISNEIELL